MNTAETREHDKRTLHVVKDAKTIDDVTEADLSKNSRIIYGARAKDISEVPSLIPVSNLRLGTRLELSLRIKRLWS